MSAASPVFLRPATASDQPALASLLQSVWGDNIGAIAYHGGGRRPGVVAEHRGELLGYAHRWRSALHPTYGYVGVHVRLDARRQGLGGQLWQEVTRGAPGPFKAKTGAEQVEGVRFLQARGLHLSVETHEPTLELARLPDQPGQAALQSASALGFELIPLSKLAGAEVLPRLTDLHPGWLWVARRGGVLAGVSSVRRTGDSARGELGWFGVPRACAAFREPLTLALTVRALQSAARDGVGAVSAELDSADPGAMHLWRSLPWTPGRRWLTFTGKPA